MSEPVPLAPRRARRRAEVQVVVSGAEADAVVALVSAAHRVVARTREVVEGTGDPEALLDAVEGLADALDPLGPLTERLGDL